MLVTWTVLLLVAVAETIEPRPQGRPDGWDVIGRFASRNRVIAGACLVLGAAISCIILGVVPMGNPVAEGIIRWLFNILTVVGLVFSFRRYKWMG